MSDSDQHQRFVARVPGKLGSHGGGHDSCAPMSSGRRMPSEYRVRDGGRRANAIELRGVVKRFGEITAVDGLDLDVPEGICLGLLGPNGAGKSTTMRMLTGQAIADEGELRVLGYELPGQSKEARIRMGVVPAARQPRHRRHRRGQPGGLRAALPGEGRDGGRRPDARPGAAARAAHGRRGQALGRYATAPAAGPWPRARTAADAARRADGRPRPADPHRDVEPDRRPAHARGDDPDVHPLHRGGRAPGRRGRGDGSGQDHRPRAPGDLRRASTPASRRPRSTGRPTAWPRRARKAESQGLQVRPAGPAIAVVGAERATDGAVPDDALRRAASLEDVFVLLTGEEAE